MHQEPSVDKQFQLMCISALIPLLLPAIGFKIGNLFKIQMSQLKDSSMSHLITIQASIQQSTPTKHLIVHS